MTPSFWKGKRVLLTGHTGFKGSWLSLWMQRLGAEVAGYSLAPPSQPSLFEIAGVSRGMRSEAGDVRDLQGLARAIGSHQAEVVVHLAAQSLVRPSYADPVETYSTNVMGTVNLLEAVRHNPSTRVVVVVTSDKCYENREWHWGYRENEPMGGHDPYSNSKGCAELVTAAFRQSYFSGEGGRVAIASARAGNVIGGGDWAADRLVPDIVRSLAAGKPAGIRRPASIRPWQHVLEPLAGYLLLAEALWRDRDRFAGGWNFGPADSEAKPVAWIAERLCRVWGDGATWSNLAVDDVHEAGLLKLDSSKARAELGWQPRLDLGQSIDWIAQWYKAHAAGADMQAFTNGQIDRYQALTVAG
jgi:CDP-glucose 4,6-dehydratase